MMRKSQPRRAWAAALLSVPLFAGCARGAGIPASSSPAAPAEVALEVPRLDGGIVAPSPSDVGGVRFGREDAKVGDRTHQHVLARSTWNDQTSTYESELVIEVLAVDGDGRRAWPSRVKVQFLKNESFDNVSHQASPVDGRTYVVDVRAPHVVLASTNAVPSEDEVLRVTDVVPDLGARTQIDQVLPDDAMHIGEHRDDLTHAIARILHPRIWSVDEGRAVLARTEGGEAVFHVTLRASSSASGMKIAVAGEARVRLRDARLDGFALAGEFVRPNGEKGDFRVSRTTTE